VTDSNELLLLRLAMLAVLLLFVLAVALSLRVGLRASRRRSPGAVPSLAATHLVVVAPARSGLPVGTEFMLAGDTSIGRDATNGIVIVDPSVSGRHAALARTPAGWVVRDLESTNGTFVGNRPIDGRGVQLRDGSQVRVGAVGLRFRD
jgi:hypothetical protein